MKNSRKGFIVPLLLILIVFVGLGIAAWKYHLIPGFNPTINNSGAAAAYGTNCTTTRAQRNDPKILVVLADFKDAKHGSYSDTAQTIKAKLDEAGAYYKENTYGTWGFTCGDVTVTPWVDVNDYYTYNIKTPSNRQIDAWMTDAAHTVTLINDEYDPSNYDFVFVVTPALDTAYNYNAFTVSQKLGGFSPITDKSSASVFVNGSQPWQVYAHELGHILGLRHFGDLICRDVSLNSEPSDYIANLEDCAGTNYSNQTVMGSSITDLPAYQRFELSTKNNFNSFGSELVQVAHTGTGGKYTITPLEASTRGAKALEILTPTGAAFWLEYRELLGFDTITDKYQRANYNQAVWATLPYSGNSFNNNGAQTIDAESTGQQPDSVLLKITSDPAVGQNVLTDTVDKMTVTIAAMDTNSITLDVEYTCPNKNCNVGTLDKIVPLYPKDNRGSCPPVTSPTKIAFTYFGLSNQISPTGWQDPTLPANGYSFQGYCGISSFTITNEDALAEFGAGIQFSRASISGPGIYDTSQFYTILPTIYTKKRNNYFYTTISYCI